MLFRDTRTTRQKKNAANKYLEKQSTQRGPSEIAKIEDKPIKGKYQR
jgi:hypothetical protein